MLPIRSTSTSKYLAFELKSALTSKPEISNELRAMVSEIIKGSKSILIAMTGGEILRLKCMAMEGLVPVDPGFTAVFPNECDYLT
jgi:hypothetical protein